jgi:hypothetical protein
VFTLLREHEYEVFIFDSDSNELINDRDAVNQASNVLAIAHPNLADVASRINER